MIHINYLLLDDERDRLSSIKSIEDFKNDIDTVMGQFHISFANNRIGFVDTDIPYDGEFIVEWLCLLNEAILYIEKYKFATIYEPDTNDLWLVFHLLDETVKVTRIRTEHQRIVRNHIENSPQNHIEILWRDNVNKRKFYESIFKVTHKFINEIESLNPRLVKSMDLIRLIKSNREAADLVLH